MTYSDDLKKLYTGNEIYFDTLNGHEKYTWKFLTFLEKYGMKPHEWDKSHPPELLPKEVKDLQDKELCDVLAMKKSLDNTTSTATTTNSNPSKNKNPNPNMEIPISDNNTQPIATPKPEEHIPKIDINEKDAQGNLKPIKTKNELAALMGTDPSLLDVQETKE